MRRMLRRDRGFHALIVVLLGLGIGSATLVFSVVNEVLLKTLPVREPDNLYLLARTTPGELRPDDYFDERHYREVVLPNPLVKAAVAEQMADNRAIVPLREGAGTKLVMAQGVSPNYFREWGVRPLIGRVLEDSDTGTAAVLSYHFWQSEYRGDSGVLGKTIRLRDKAFPIVGVLPREFHSSDVDRAPEVRISMSAARALYANDKEGVSYRLLLRLVPGASAPAAGASLLPGLEATDKALDALRQRGPDPDKYTALIQPIPHGVSRMRDQFGGALRALLAGVGLLLFAVCANVAGLLIAKSGDRRKEIGIRMAIGAGRGQIVRQLLAESLLLAIGGAALGGAFAGIVARKITTVLPPARDLAQFATPQLLAIAPDWRVLGFAAAATLFVVVASGLVPAWRAARLDLVSEIKASPGQRRHGRAGIVSVALQAAFSMILLSAAGLMVRTWQNLDHLDPGFDRYHLISFTIDPASAGYKMEQSGAVAAELRRRVDGLPGVHSTAWAWRALMRGSGIKSTIAPQGVVLPPSTFLNTSLNDVTPGYFETMGIRLLAGRTLELRDVGVQPAPVVVNQAFARQFFPGQSAVGKYLVTGKDGTKAPSRVIVGVVNTAKYRSMREPDPPTLYAAWDASKGSDWQTHLYVRTKGDPKAVATAVRQTLHDVDPGVPLVETATLDSEIRASLWQERLVAILGSFFGAAAAGLAAIGLYAALTLSVAQRRREIAIRVAVGAGKRRLVEAVCSTMATGVVLGLLAGLVGAAALLQFSRSLLFGVQPFDPVSLASAAGIVVFASIVAALRPVRRAGRVDPAISLREE
jgi:predicted permease